MSEARGLPSTWSEADRRRQRKREESEKCGARVGRAEDVGVRNYLSSLHDDQLVGCVGPRRAVNSAVDRRRARATSLYGSMCRTCSVACESPMLVLTGPRSARPSARGRVTVARRIPVARYIALPGGVCIVYSATRSWLEAMRFIGGERGAAESIGARHRPVHRHRRIDREGCRARRRKLAELVRHASRVVGEMFDRYRGRDGLVRRRVLRNLRRTRSRRSLRPGYRRRLYEPLRLEIRAGLPYRRDRRSRRWRPRIAVHIGARVGALAQALRNPRVVQR